MFNFFCQGTVNEHHHVHSDECRYSYDIQRGEHPYLSEVCSRAFSRKSSLITQHMLSGEGHYVCDVCNKAYSGKSSLIKHKRTHSGARPYSCEVCNKAFSQQSHLITHQRIHSGARPLTVKYVIRHSVERAV